MKPQNIDVDKLFMAYEECRADNTAHFRKIMELQKENEKLEAKLAKACAALERIEKYGDTSLWISGEIAQEALKEIE